MIKLGLLLKGRKPLPPHTRRNYGKKEHILFEKQDSGAWDAVTTGDVENRFAEKKVRHQKKEREKTKKQKKEKFAVKKSFTLVISKENNMREVVGLLPSQVALMKSEMPKKDKPLDSKKEWKTAHRTAPKEYGDVRYADPEGHRYPIDSPEHIRAAARYLAKQKNSSYYPPEKLSKMWSAIRSAAKKHGVDVSEHDGKKKED